MKYQAYSEYKDSGIEWLGDVPPHWVTLPLKRVCSLVTGLTPPTSNEAHYIDYDSGRPWIRPDDLNEEGVVTRASKFLSQSGWGLMKIVPKGSTLICCIGTIGKAGYIDVDVSTNQQITSASFRQNPRYYYYLVRAAKKVFEETATGNVIRILNSERLGGVPFLSVPIDEAKKIADFLDHETAKIDNLIEKQQQLITLLKEKRQAVISHAVTKGLNPDAPMRDSGVEWLGEVPRHWVVAGFKKYLNKIVDYRGKTPEKHDSGVFLVTAKNIKNGRIDYNLSQEYVAADDYEGIMSRGKPKSGEILFTTEAPLGEVALVDREDIALAQRIIKFDGVLGVLNNRYLKYLIMSEQFQSSLIMFSSGSTALGIKAERLIYLKAIIPPEEEQSKIVEHIDLLINKIDHLTSKAQSQIDLISERRAALISAAVTGKIDVRNWQALTPTANQPDDKAVAA